MNIDDMDTLRLRFRCLSSKSEIVAATRGLITNVPTTQWRALGPGGAESGCDAEASVQKLHHARELTRGAAWKAAGKRRGRVKKLNDDVWLVSLRLFWVQ